MPPEAMKILRSVTVTLSEEELTKIVKKHLEKEGFEVQNVDFKVSRDTMGYGPGEYEVTKFHGCTASCRLITERRDND